MLYLLFLASTLSCVSCPGRISSSKAPRNQCSLNYRKTLVRISRIKISNFRRFFDLEISEIPAVAKLVVLAGPNGSGKSSLFDAFLTRYRSSGGYGWNGDFKYYDRVQSGGDDPASRIVLEAHGGLAMSRGSVYLRTAYRNDPEFVTSSLSRQAPILETMAIQKLIQTDATVGSNYMRLASQAMEDVFVNESDAMTLRQFRDKVLGEVREPFRRLFPELTLVGIGNPLDKGTFRFDKGAVRNFDYQNLSGGEKAAFDLLLDIVIKRHEYQDAIYCIDEPETHMNTKVQGALLQEILELVPQDSQLWIASHSIGMMRKARELYSANPGSVTFLDFGGRSFDEVTAIKPQAPTRAFWESVLSVALDDLATLVAPRQVVICEGNPLGHVSGKNVEHDARVYSTIFAAEFPDVTFISAGSSNQISGDFLGLATALPKVAAGMTVFRLIDLDDHSPADVAGFRQQQITVLSKRHLEAYLFNDETLAVLCNSVGRPGEVANVLAAKQQAMADSHQRGNPPDDVKSAAGVIYTETKRILSITQGGNDRNAFARNTLAPLIQPGMAVYSQMKFDIFGLD